MKAIRKWFIMLLFALLFTMPTTWAIAGEPMTVVADSYNQNKAQKWVDFLLSKEVKVEFCEPADFDSVKTAKYIAIMGGVDDPDIKKLITDIIGAEEVDALAQKGAKKMFVKNGYGAQDQEMLIFTGSDSDAAADARVESKETWMPILTEWFDLDEGPGSLQMY
jgi:hypothetical protein